MRLYNTLTRTIQDFEPLDRKTVRMYVCGPTVYDDPHIGHARSAYIFDVLRRYLEYKKFTVTFVRNVTDVDDKIIEKARHQTQELTEQCREVAEHYLKRYHETMDRLGIGRPTHEPLATGHIDEMVNLISQLVVNGSAYETKTGDVYFAVRKFPGYGKLSNRSVDELQAGARVEPGEHPAHSEALGGAGKQDPLDFALWKAAKPDEPAWKSPWGKGRPGWHIECSAMSTKYLGDEFDIHGGGVDLVFPHHENEIAQAKAAKPDKSFARYWIHNGLLTVNGEKMSKSLGNFITVEQALKDCGGGVDILKTFFLSTHYRSPIDYSIKNMKTSENRYERLLYFLRRTDDWRQELAPSTEPDVIKILDEAVDQFNNVMDNDLNTPQALAVLNNLVSEGQTAEVSGILAEGMKVNPTILRGRVLAIANRLIKLGKMLGLFQDYQPTHASSNVKKLVADREVARKEKDFKKSDQIRLEVDRLGFLIEDTPMGPVVLPKQ